MPANSNENEPNGAGGTSGDGNTVLTPELVRKVADKVYAMLLLDLRLERERHNSPRRHSGAGRGTR
jgi:hypothetical protein